MIRHLQNGQIDRDKWDECIADAFNGYAYGFTWYLDIVSPGWEALVEDDYLRVFPLPRAEKFRLVYSMQPPFTQQLGVFSKTSLSADDIEAFLKAIPSCYRFIDLNFNVFNQILPGSRKICNMVNYELDLIADYDKLKGGYSDNIRRNVKKGIENRLTLVKNIRPEDVVTLFRQNRGKLLKNMGDEQYRVLLRLIYAGIHKCMIGVWGTYDAHNELCAGVVWLFSHRKAIFLFSGLSETGRNLGAMPFMIDSFIGEHAGQQMTLDFEGSNDEGLARFYAGFGSQKVIYQRVVINRLSRVMNLSVQIARKLRSIF